MSLIDNLFNKVRDFFNQMDSTLIEPTDQTPPTPSVPVEPVAVKPVVTQLPKSREDQNIDAFLDMIAISELGEGLLAASDDGYNVIVGSTAKKPNLFTSYATHPNVLVHFDNGTPPSTAAGRYQIMYRFFVAYKKILNLPDFGKESQRKIAMQYFKECHALDDIKAGRVESAIVKCRSRWASFPASGHDQHEQTMSRLVTAYQSKGGVINVA